MTKLKNFGNMVRLYNWDDFLDKTIQANAFCTVSPFHNFPSKHSLTSFCLGFLVLLSSSLSVPELSLNRLGADCCLLNLTLFFSCKERIHASHLRLFWSALVLTSGGDVGTSSKLSLGLEPFPFKLSKPSSSFSADGLRSFSPPLLQAKTLTN